MSLPLVLSVIFSVVSFVAFLYSVKVGLDLIRFFREARAELSNLMGEDEWQ